ncbi:MAG: hypothetical protein J6S84_03475, partial [Bacteroidales bacterium]|nr:hypothetical protein [Bacteroidales bacterium]
MDTISTKLGNSQYVPTHKNIMGGGQVIDNQIVVSRRHCASIGNPNENSFPHSEQCEGSGKHPLKSQFVNRKSLLAVIFTLLMVFFVPLAMNGQEPCGTIGTGTSTSNRFPINTYYNYFTTQSLYTASEVNTALSGNTTI